MRRISLTAALAAAGLLALTGTASADVGDITNFRINDDPEGTAEAAQVTGVVRCTTTIDYGLVGKVAQGGTPFDPADETSGTAPKWTDGVEESNNADVEGVGAFGPNQGNEQNTPCSTNLQSWEIVIQRNRDSGTYVEDEMGQLVFVGTSAENQNRGPGPFIGDLEYGWQDGDYTRTDP